MGMANRGMIVMVAPLFLCHAWLPSHRHLRHRFRDCSVVVFGSSLSELATLNSDIDLSMILPDVQRRTEVLEEQMRTAQAEYSRLSSEVR